MFRIIESIPSKNAEPIKQWLAKIGKEKIDEVFDYVDAPDYYKERVRDFDEDKYDKDDFDLNR